MISNHIALLLLISALFFDVIKPHPENLDHIRAILKIRVSFLKSMDTKNGNIINRNGH
jgi:hypothetical protein